MSEVENFVWEQKYRPKKVSECVLPKNIKDLLQGYVDNKKIPTLLFTGASGISKTTNAIAMCEELNLPYKIINCSMNRNLDTVRDEIVSYAGTMSVTKSDKKVIILDECDYMSQNSFAAMRGVIDQYGKTCSFIATCNYPNKILVPVQERFQRIDFIFKDPKENRILREEFSKRCQKILDNETIQYEPEDIKLVVDKYFPNFRRIINTLQMCSQTGTLVVNNQFDELEFSQLLDYIKSGKMIMWRKWVANALIVADYTTIIRLFYDNVKTILYTKDVSNVCNMELMLGELMHRCYFSNDIEITMSAFFADCYQNIKFAED